MISLVQKPSVGYLRKNRLFYYTRGLNTNMKYTRQIQSKEISVVARLSKFMHVTFRLTDEKDSQLLTCIPLLQLR
jgi:hypothetical protein